MKSSGFGRSAERKNEIPFHKFLERAAIMSTPDYQAIETCYSIPSSLRKARIMVLTAIPFLLIGVVSFGIVPVLSGQIPRITPFPFLCACIGVILTVIGSCIMNIHARGRLNRLKSAVPTWISHNGPLHVEKLTIRHDERTHLITCIKQKQLSPYLELRDEERVIVDVRAE